MKVLVLGASGMAGHIISIYLSEKGHNVTGATRKPVSYVNNIILDVEDLKKLNEVITQGEYDAIINAVGILNMDAEMNKSKAVFINSYLPHYLQDIMRNSKTKIIHLSTDCVFSGNDGNYLEDAFKDGDTFYDRTKALGELNNDKDITFRNSIIGPDYNNSGIGLFNWFMQQEGNIKGFNKAIWTGVTTLTLAKAINKVLNQNLAGIYHLVNNQTISKYELLNLFNKNFNREVQIEIEDEFSVNKSLVNSRKDFDFEVPSYEQMIIEMKDWINNHKEIYPHYFN